MREFNFRNLAIYLFGLFILAVGVAFSINANLGISPVNATPYVTSLILNLSVGNGLIIFFVLLILFQRVILRKKFKLSNFSQILAAILFGVFVDFSIFLIGDFAFFTHLYIGRVLTLLFSIFILSLGLALYVRSKLIPMPPEGVLLALISLFPKYSIGTMKIFFDICIVILAIILSLIFLGGLYGVREGTIFTALVMGRAMSSWDKFFNFILKVTKK